MTYTFEIKKTKESLPLIAHLQTLKYVKQKKDHKILTDTAIAKAVKLAEKSESILWSDFKREAKTWKNKITK